MAVLVIDCVECARFALRSDNQLARPAVRLHRLGRGIAARRNHRAHRIGDVRRRIGAADVDAGHGNPGAIAVQHDLQAPRRVMTQPVAASPDCTRPRHSGKIHPGQRCPHRGFGGKAQRGIGIRQRKRMVAQIADAPPYIVRHVDQRAIARQDQVFAIAIGHDEMAHAGDIFDCGRPDRPWPADHQTGAERGAPGAGGDDNRLFVRADGMQRCRAQPDDGKCPGHPGQP